MNFNQIKSLFAVSPKLAFVALAMTATALLVACGGGGSVAVDPPQTAVATTNLRALPAEYLARKAVSYSPFRTANRDTETPTETQIKQDLDLLVAGNFRLIRLFDSSDKVSKLTLKVIHDNGMDIKVHLGAYVNSYKYVYNPVVNASIKTGNQAELDRLIALATNPDYKDIVLAVSVGNETMVSWSSVPIDPADMAGYISYVRAKVTQPVTTDDNFGFYAEIPQRISDLIDFASIHTYTEIDTQYPASPYFWDWRQEGVALGVGGDKTARATAMMNASMVATRAQYQMVRDSLDRKGLRNVPIVIGETGWNAVDLGKLRFRAGPVNQKMYFTRLETWRAEGRVGPGPANVFYFEAFDEPWKTGDDGWGLFNVKREARCVVQALSATYSAEKDSNGNVVSCADTNVNAYVAPTPTAAVTDAKLVIHSESVTGWPTGMRADAYEPFTFTLDYPATGDSASGDQAASLAGSHYIKLSAFAPKTYGWGLLWQSSASPAAAVNMSNFANGSIHFSVKTGYVGKLRIGISSDTELNGATESFVLVSNSDGYGYCNNSAKWCDVSIPLTAFKAANPDIDLRYVLTRFSISDVYSATGNADATGQPEIRLDNIYWSQQ